MTRSTDLADLSRVAEHRQGPFTGHKLKRFRRVATRYEKLAVNFLAMIQHASLRLWLGVSGIGRSLSEDFDDHAVRPNSRGSISLAHVVRARGAISALRYLPKMRRLSCFHARMKA